MKFIQIYKVKEYYIINHKPYTYKLNKPKIS